ncbi:MAG: patatin-like phospholipase family protein, partial [Schleiferiaceae bacterium]|nr:patatin-like phospholipase family protein [Schleiferiaceae bacterium]
MKTKILVFLSLYYLVVTAQEELKVGLALSGGGAKGMAHVGVLRALEENNVRIDYISGTSMGAVVGAMYAMGYTVDQIEIYLTQVDWDALMDNTLPRNHLGVLERENAEKYVLDFEVVDDKINAPDAFNKGQYMLKELSFLTFPAHGIKDFSQLQIPFLCMATDLVTGAEKVLEEGELSEALRASLAFPSMFSPFKINNKPYIDGGVRNNLPIAILKDEKGMDFVIASNVQGRLYTEEELNSMIQILEQVSSYSNALGFKDQLKKVDLMISPPEQRFDLTGYELSDTIIGLGYKEAMKHIDILDQLPKKKTEVLIVNDLRRMDPFLINDVEVVGNENTTSRYVRSKLKLKKPRVYTSKKLDEGLDRLYGSNYYEYLDFDLIKVDTAYKLIVNLKERKSDMTLRTGIHYDDDFGIGILLNVTLRNALVSNSRFTIDAVLSENPRGKITYVFDRGYIPALGFQFAFNRFGTRIYSNREAITS